ncbi:MAG TPA: branched-chain amino acid ABC transporter ATP-binding protein/permease [Acidimicrobiales bacterium]|nr:branched-chain amino acid ABC transporter ATP-binding protein/permease [Acidimicrobiales bacterium]
MSRLKAAGVLLALFVVPLLGARVLPDRFTGIESQVLGLGVCLAAAALALNIVMGYAGQISLGHFALLGVGGFTCGVLTSADRFALPYLVSVPAAALTGAVVGLLVGLPALRLRGLYLAIATIGFSYAMEKSIFRARDLTGGSSGIEVPRPIADTFHFLKAMDYLAILLVLLGLLWLVDVNVTRSRVGRAFRAVKASEPVAASFGIDVGLHKLFAFGLSGAFAGVAGAMYAPLVGTVNAGSFSYQASLLLVVIVVIGGLGSRVGVVAAAIVYAELPRLLIGIFGERLRGWDLVLGAAGLMLAVRNHPGGVAEMLQHRRERRAAAAAGIDADGDAAVVPALPRMPRPATVVRERGPDDGTMLRVEGVSVRFGDLYAVREAGFSVRTGEIAGLIGPNGAGKTTLFNAIAGLVPIQSGRIAFLGRDITALPPHARAAAGIGRTFQGIGLAKDLTVTENLLLAQHSLAGYSAAEALTGFGRVRGVEDELRARAREAIAALGFEAKADQPVRLLSHGQQRIVELGCVLLTAPDLVLLDEPSAGMSPGAAENLAVRLRDIRDELGRTVLLIEHNLPLVLDVCDSLTVLSSGEVIASGTVDEVAQQADVVSAYLGEAPPVPGSTATEAVRA